MPFQVNKQTAECVGRLSMSRGISLGTESLELTRVPCHVSISMDWVDLRTKDHFQDSPQKCEPKATLLGSERKSVNLKAILSS